MSSVDLTGVPTPSADTIAIRLHPEGERAVRDGHPWVFESSVRSASQQGRAGDVAVIFDRKNRFLAVGLLDPGSPIRIRVLNVGASAPVGEGMLEERLIQALDRRRGLVGDDATTGFRVVNGAGDGLPGVVVDRYGDALVVKLYSAAWIPRLHQLVPALIATLRPLCIVGLVSRIVGASPACPGRLASGTVLAGDFTGGPLPFLETGLRFESHPLEGHKTGFYLDQRENRGRVEELSTGARVLNVFSYTGGFSVYAGRGGACEVTSVDISHPALDQAVRHFEANRAADPSHFGDTPHRAVQGDAFRVLDAMGTRGERFDLVIVDPPAFAKSGREAAAALASYGKLTELALAVLEAGGILVQASCSSRVASAEFFQGIHVAARRAGRRLSEIGRTGHPVDHPFRHPEGEYLKCLFARAH